MNIIANSKNAYGTCREILLTGLARAYTDNRLKNHALEQKKQFVKSNAIYADEQIEEYENYLILKNIYLDFDKNIAPKDFSHIKTNKHFRSIQTELGERSCISQLRSVDIPTRNSEKRIEKTHQIPYICAQANRLLPFIIWQLQCVYVTCQLADIDPNTCRLLFTQPKYQIDLDTKTHQIYTTAFKTANSTNMKGTHLFERLIILKQKRVLMCAQMNQKFQNFVLSKFGIQPPPPTQQVKKVTLVLRRNYYPHTNLNQPQIVYRKVANEESLIAAIRHYLPNIKVQAIELNQLGIKEQLELLTQTDILIGLHGAALAFNTFLPTNAGIFEIIPFTLKQGHHFSTYYRIAVSRELYYKRWISWNPLRNQCSREYWEFKKKQRRKKIARPKNDLTALPSKSVAKKVASLVHLMNVTNVQLTENL